MIVTLIVSISLSATVNLTVAEQAKTSPVDLRPNSFVNTTRSFGVSIYFFGNSSVTEGAYHPAPIKVNGLTTYDIIATQDVTIGVVKFDYSGVVKVKGKDTAGQIFVITNNLIKYVNSGSEYGSSGVTVPLSQGDSFISVLYVAFNGTGSYTLAYDTIYVRVRTSITGFEFAPNLIGIPTNLKAVDTYNSSAKYPLDFAATNFNAPYQNLTFGYGKTSIGAGDTVNPSDIQNAKGIEVGGAFNTSGTLAFNATFLNGTTSAPGFNMYVDDLGVHAMTGTSFTSHFKFSKGTGSNYFGILTLDPQGFQTSSLVNSDAGQSSNVAYFSGVGASLQGLEFTLAGTYIDYTTTVARSPLSILSILAAFGVGMLVLVIKKRKF